jgi:PAS domain S-box-containing protein
MLGLTVQDLVPESIRSTLSKLNKRITAEGRLFLQAENIRKNGEVFPCEVNIVVTRLGGQPRVITYVRDITKRKLAEQALQEA